MKYNKVTGEAIDAEARFWDMNNKVTSELTQAEYMAECHPTSAEVKERWVKSGKPDNVFALFPRAFKMHIRKCVKNFSALP